MQEPISISLRCRSISGEHFLGRREATIGNGSIACNEKCPCLKTILQGTTANATLPPPLKVYKMGIEKINAVNGKRQLTGTDIFKRVNPSLIAN